MDESLKQSAVFNDDEVDDGSGTGGVGGLFSMTVTEDEEVKALGHFNENPFLETEDAEPEEKEPKPESIVSEETKSVIIE